MEPNPRLPRPIKVALLATCLLIPLGIALLVPSLSIPRWPWQIPPFNARFIGVIYVSGWLGAFCSLWAGRRNPALGFLRAAAVFTTVATLASFVHTRTFLWAERPAAVALWWLAYVGFAVALTLAARHLAPSLAAEPSLPQSRRGLYGLYAALTTAYGLALFLAPRAAAGFWPWPVDAFHGRVYSGIFLSGGILLWGLRRHERTVDLALAGLLQAVFGLGAVWGAWSVNRALQRVAWNAGETLPWLLLFGGVGLAGLAMLFEALRRRWRET